MKINKKIWISVLIFFSLCLLVSITYVIPLTLQHFDSAKEKKIKAVAKKSTKAETADIIIQPFKRTVTEQGRDQVEIEAERAEIDQKNNYFTLKKISKGIFYGKNNEKFVIKADIGTWDSQNRIVNARGNIQGQIIQKADRNPVDFTCDWLTYIWKKRLVRGGDKVFISQGPYRASGKHIRIELDNNRAVLAGEVQTTIDPDAFRKAPVQMKAPVLVKSQRMVFHTDKSVLEYEGNPQINSDQGLLRAGKITFAFGESKYFLAQDGVEVITRPFPSDAMGPQAPVTIKASVCQADIQSGEIRFKDQVQVIQRTSTLLTDELTFQLDSASRELLAVNADKNVKYMDQEISGSGDHALYSPTDDQLILAGNARITYDTGNVITARQFRLFPKRKFYIAENEIMIRYIPKEGNSRPVARSGSHVTLPELKPGVPVIFHCDHLTLDDAAGILNLTGDVRGKQDIYTFGSDEMTLRFDPVSKELLTMHAEKNVHTAQNDEVLTGDSMDYDLQTDELKLTGNAMYWKGKTRIKADRFVYHRQTGRIDLNGSIDMAVDSKSGVPVPGESEPSDSVILLNADDGWINENDGRAEFNGNVVVHWDTWEITADKLKLELNSETKAVKEVIAEENVTVHHEELKATGSTLTYDVENSIIVLRGAEGGKCKVWMNERGSQAEQLTVYVDENRVEIENGLSIMMPGELNGNIR